MTRLRSWFVALISDAVLDALKRHDEQIELELRRLDPGGARGAGWDPKVAAHRQRLSIYK